MRSKKEAPEIAVGGNNINNLYYVDDTVQIAASQKDLKQMIDQCRGINLDNIMYIRLMSYKKFGQKAHSMHPKITGNLCMV